LLAVILAALESPFFIFKSTARCNRGGMCSDGMSKKQEQQRGQKQKKAEMGRSTSEAMKP
jgi:hypothetical protein